MFLHKMYFYHKEICLKKQPHSQKNAGLYPGDRRGLVKKRDKRESGNPSAGLKHKKTPESLAMFRPQELLFSFYSSHTFYDDGIFAIRFLAQDTFRIALGNVKKMLHLGLASGLDSLGSKAQIPTPGVSIARGVVSGKDREPSQIGLRSWQ